MLKDFCKKRKVNQFYITILPKMILGITVQKVKNFYLMSGIFLFLLICLLYIVFNRVTNDFAFPNSLGIAGVCILFLGIALWAVIGLGVYSNPECMRLAELYEEIDENHLKHFDAARHHTRLLASKISLWFYIPIGLISIVTFLWIHLFNRLS